MTETSTPFDRVNSYLTGSAFDLSVRGLRSYYAADESGPHWTGSQFDRLADATTPNAFTADDMLAVSMLSVNVPPRAALWLIEGKTMKDMLSTIPDGAHVMDHPDKTSLWERPELLDRDSPAWRLSVMVEGRRGIGPTIASKIIAAKRPHLLPVYDQHVNTALNFGPSPWGFFQQVAWDERAPELLTKIDQAKASAEVPEYVSALRIIDVVVWIRQHGWTMHEVDSCKFNCDFGSFGAAGYT